MSDVRANMPAVVKRLVWNLKYGVLGYSHAVAPGDVLDLLNDRLEANSSLLELGAGRGSLFRGLRRQGWDGSYCGVDISRQAIKHAQQSSDQRSTWVVSDIEHFSSSLKWDVIAFVESICYVNVQLIPDVFARYLGMLKENGFLLIRLHDFDKFREYIDAVQQLCPHAELVGGNIFVISAHEIRQTAEVPISAKSNVA